MRCVCVKRGNLIIVNDVLSGSQFANRSLLRKLGVMKTYLSTGMLRRREEETEALNHMSRGFSGIVRGKSQACNLMFEVTGGVA